MRDIAVFVTLLGTLPFVLYRPWYGILVLAWLGYMNPHRLTWGFVNTMPVVFIVFLVLLVSLLFAKKEYRGKLVFTREIAVLVIFLLWMFITTNFAIYSNLAWEQWDKVWKVQLIIFLTVLLIDNKEKINSLIWTIVLSLGFYGVKGGIFTIMTAGAFRVQGPPGSFIYGNNEMGLALLLTIPLMRYLQLTTSNKNIKLSLNVMMFLTLISIMGTHSRGALVAAVFMGAFLLLKSRKKFFLMLLGIVFISSVITFAPTKWFERMNTIESFKEDKSALGRINAWTFAYNLAKDRSLGGGFETFRYGMFKIYAPIATDVHDAHSIYFEVLGEHGFVGLTIFLTLWLFTWLSASQVIKKVKYYDELLWMRDLMSMIQVSIVAYAMGGAFLGLAYFDLPYHLIAIVIIVKVLCKKEVTRIEAEIKSEKEIEKMEPISKLLLR